MTRRVPPLAIGVAIVALVVDIVVIPLMQLSSSNPESWIWLASQFAVLGVGLVAILVFPRWRNRALSQQARSQILEGQVAFAAAMKNELGVVCASSEGLEIDGQQTGPRFLTWDNVDRLNEERFDEWPHYRIRIVLVDGESMWVQPLDANAVQPAKEVQVLRHLSAMEGVRTR